MEQQEEYKQSIAREAEEKKIELVIGNLLRFCVILTVVIVVIGAILYLPKAASARMSFSTFLSEPYSLRSVWQIISTAFSGDGLSIIQMGLLMLILTPILRVVFSAAAFLSEKDYLYVTLTLIVLALLVFSLSGG